MARYKIGHTGPGAVNIEVRPLGLAVLQPDLAMIAPGQSTRIARQDFENLTRFSLDDAQVTQLRGSPNASAAPYLALLCDAFLVPDAPARNWGWEMRLTRDGATGLPVTFDDGTAVPLDREGFAHIPMADFPNGVGVAHGYDIISLA